jgi:hypothetical protein
VRAGALGDVLLLRAAIAWLRQAGFGVTLTAPRASGAVLVGPGEAEVDRLIDWDAPECAALLDGDVALTQSLREVLGACALAVVCSRNATLAARLREVILDVRTVDPQPPPGMHAARWYCSALPEFAQDADPPLLSSTADEEAHAAPWRERLPPDFVAIHPGSGSPTKNWPADRFAELARALSPDRPWLLIAGPADANAIAPLAALPGAVLARDLPVRVLAALLAQARLYVGNDSGITHLAAAYGAPTLALFGPTEPSQWSPVGPSVTVLRAPDGVLDRLSLAEILEAVPRET